jgi:hypothetical protein
MISLGKVNKTEVNSWTSIVYPIFLSSRLLQIHGRRPQTMTTSYLTWFLFILHGSTVFRITSIVTFFLRDMRSKELSSHFCSPLLVNSILAVACVSLYLDFLIYRQLTRLSMHSFTRITMKLLLYRMKLVPAVNIFLKRQFVCFGMKTEDCLLPLYKRKGIFILGTYRPNLLCSYKSENWLNLTGLVGWVGKNWLCNNWPK